MEYITVKEASELWKTDISTIGKLLRAGKIPGAAKLGGHWVIPKDMPKPIDGRTKKGKESQNATIFRFPLFVNSPAKSFVPPLSSEEALLRQAQVDFYACEFQKSKPVFIKLAENAENIYVKICAHFFMCLLSVVYDKSISFNQYYCSMNVLLSSDFPYKKEMELFEPFLDYSLGQFMKIPEKLNSDIFYEFHPSALFMNAFLSIFKLSKKTIESEDLSFLEAYETLCTVAEHQGYYTEAQKLHIVLFLVYFTVNIEKSMRYHMGKAVKIAYDHNLIYNIADISGFYGNEVNKALQDYPVSFAKQIKKSSKIIFENYARFAANTDITNLYLRLSGCDYHYLVFAINGLSNKQIAEILNVSERTVAKQYLGIYNKLGVNNKQELVTEIGISLGKKE